MWIFLPQKGSLAIVQFAEEIDLPGPWISSCKIDQRKHMVAKK